MGDCTPKVFSISDVSAQARFIAKNARFAKVFEFIKSNGLGKLADFPDGKHVIDGDELFVNFSNSKLKKPEDAKFEVHNKYVDLQLLIKGERERMGVKPRAKLENMKEDKLAEKDVIFYSDTPENFVELKAGEYVVFFPEDGHAPMIGEGEVKKCIFKILAD